MKRASSPWIRLSVTFAIGLVSCLHTVAPRVAPSGRLQLSESASGPHGRVPFAVVAAGPRGEIATDNDPGITLVFNRAMREVDGSPLAGLPPVTIRTEEGDPSRGASGGWARTACCSSPTANSRAPARFKVSVPRGTRSLDQSVLASDYTLEFTTVRPQLADTFPRVGSHQARASDPIFLKFSQAIEPAGITEVAAGVVGSRRSKDWAASYR